MRESLLRPLQIIILLSALALSACTSVTDLKDSLSERLFGRESNEEPSELTEIKSTAQAKVLWNAHLGASEANDFVPVLDNGFIYAASANGELVKLVATDGKQVWKVKAEEPFTGGVGIGSPFRIFTTCLYATGSFKMLVNMVIQCAFKKPCR